MQLALQNFITLILSLIALSALIMYRREVNFRQKFQNTINQSVAKSKNILDEAELNSVKVVADTRFHTQRMEEEMGREVEDLIREAQRTINAHSLKFVQFLENLQKDAQLIQKESQKNTAERINQLFGSLEQRLADFLVETSQKTSSTLELELKSARALIETYKQEQLKLIDENILSMMEQTLSTVLNKKLSLEDHLDLVYEALEKAKVEKFIV